MENLKNVIANAGIVLPEVHQAQGPEEFCDVACVICATSLA